MSDPRISRRVRRAAAALIDHYVLDGVDLIIAEGDFWITGQRDESTDALSSGIAPVFVTLRVSVDEALRRVSWMPTSRCRGYQRYCVEAMRISRRRRRSLET